MYVALFHEVPCFAHARWMDLRLSMPEAEIIPSSPFWSDSDLHERAPEVFLIPKTSLLNLSCTTQGVEAFTYTLHSAPTKGVGTYSALIQHLFVIQPHHQSGSEPFTPELALQHLNK